MRVQVEVHDKVTSVEFVDSLIRARLLEIRDGLVLWSVEPDIRAACQTLLDWMEQPTCD